MIIIDLGWNYNPYFKVTELLSVQQINILVKLTTTKKNL